MAIKILEMKREDCPAARFIGKKYMDAPNWGEWWANGWFDLLEQTEGLPINDHGYIGAVHIVDGMPERWIGMFFPADTPVPEEFEAVDMAPLSYAVFYLYGAEGSGEFYAPETHDMCLAELKRNHLLRKEDDWCFERCNCPRYTTPDEKGNIILDYAISIIAE